MNLLAIFQLRTKRFWWMDVILYFVASLLVATVFCYVIFLVKVRIVEQKIALEDSRLKEVGTQSQKDHETEVIKYKKRIEDFSRILNNHKFASNVFAFIQDQTMPNVWFNQFSFDPKNTSLQLQGEAEDLDSVSRQVSALEKNTYVKGIGTLSSSQSQSSKIQFSMSVSLQPKILNYSENLSLARALKAEWSGNESASNNQGNFDGSSANPVKSNQKIITSFKLLLNPEVVGQIDQNKKIITLIVPYGTDVKKIVPSIAISKNATINPSTLTPQDFSNFVDYKVTAEDGSSQVYRVVVSVSPGKSAKKGFSWIWVVAIIILFGVIGAIIITYIEKKKNVH